LLQLVANNLDLRKIASHDAEALSTNFIFNYVSIQSVIQNFYSLSTKLASEIAIYPLHPRGRLCFSIVLRNHVEASSSYALGG
jgi:hypothetical protein